MISRFKKFAIRQSINHPLRTLIISLIITIIMGSGLRYFIIEDDMMKMIPKTIKTRIVWDEVKDEFGNTEMVFVAFGNDKINLFNDLDDLMSIIKNLDIFVTVSNSTAHLAAAMGVKTILICPRKSSTYFYWSNENNKTPWYKNVEIFQIERSVKETIENINKVLNKI